jgi:ATP-binding cassette subfamily B protein
VVDAHEILVMDAGRIIERGNHAALLEAHGRYADMWALQQQSGDRSDDKIELKSTPNIDSLL